MIDLGEAVLPQYVGGVFVFRHNADSDDPDIMVVEEFPHDQIKNFVVISFVPFLPEQPVTDADFLDRCMVSVDLHQTAEAVLRKDAEEHRLRLFLFLQPTDYLRRFILPFQQDGRKHLIDVLLRGEFSQPFLIGEGEWPQTDSVPCEDRRIGKEPVDVTA